MTPTWARTFIYVEKQSINSLKADRITHFQKVKDIIKITMKDLEKFGFKKKTDS